MHPLAVLKMNKPFGLGGHAARVLGGLYGQVEPSPNNPSKRIFYIDPVLKHAFPSVDMVGGGNGIEIGAHEVVELMLPDANHITALKRMLCEGLGHRWADLYEKQLNSLTPQYGGERTILYSMLEAERDKALNALRSVTNDQQGMIPDTVDVVAKYSAFDGERFHSGNLSPADNTELQSESTGLSREELFSDDDDGQRLYDVYASVSIMAPAPMIPVVSQHAIAHNSTEGNGALVEQSTHRDLFKDLLFSESIFPLWADTIRTIKLENVDLQRSKTSLLHVEGEDDYDYWDEIDDDVEFDSPTPGLPRPHQD